MSETVRLRRHALDDPVVLRLIRDLNAELSEIYTEPGETFFRLDPEDVAEGRGAFLVAYESDQPVGCGAVRLLADGAVEIKRMYVVPEARGRGLGRVILQGLEGEAVRLGADRVVLETGIHQHAAIALYESHGFTHIPAFGEYVDSAVSVCMAKSLAR